jgi:hypothetical protein
MGLLGVLLLGVLPAMVLASCSFGGAGVLVSWLGCVVDFSRGPPQLEEHASKSLVFTVSTIAHALMHVGREGGCV